MNRPTYEQAYRREQIQGRWTVLAWIIAFFAGPVVPDGWPGLAWAVMLLFWMSFILKHWSRDAVRHRAYWNSDQG